jgi:hypothetical protein
MNALTAGAAHYALLLVPIALISVMVARNAREALFVLTVVGTLVVALATKKRDGTALTVRIGRDATLCFHPRRRRT